MSDFLLTAHHTSVAGRRGGRRAFSLAELLVVMGVIALLVALLLPALQGAKRQAQQTQCAAHLQQLGVALASVHAEYRNYPMWDDFNAPVRFTWIDMLIQRGHFANARGGYCPDDLRPDPLNAGRAAFFSLSYPGKSPAPGVDYSYGIAASLSGNAAPWAQRAQGRLDFTNHTARRVLAGDAHWAAIFNLSGQATADTPWNFPTQWDNTAAWRHSGRSANLLFQDGHVARVALGATHADTIRHFVWESNESANVSPNQFWQENWYPASPADAAPAEGAVLAARELSPAYYTVHNLWTRIEHK